MKPLTEQQIIDIAFGCIEECSDIPLLAFEEKEEQEIRYKWLKFCYYSVDNFNHF